MKTEHRHELKEHELRKLTGKAQQFFEKNGNQVLLGTLAALVVIVGIAWWISSSSARTAEGWQQFAVARTAEDYANLAEKHPGTEVSQWARLTEAEMHVGDAENMLFSDSSGRNAALKKSEKIFDTVLKSTPLSDEMRERALYGLARTQEILDPELAAKAYDSLAKDFPNSVYAEDAKRRATSLREGSAKEFYAWFNQQTLKPEDIRGPKDFGMPPGHPAIPGSGNGALNLDDFLPPGFGTPRKPAADAPAEAELPDEAPAKKPDAAPPESKPDAQPDPAKPEPGKDDK
jgi:hypothetical protein